MSVDNLLLRLDKVKPVGKCRWLACCPAHADKSPSLSIRELDDGRVLVHCFGGCSSYSVLEAIGLTINDLFPEHEHIHHAKCERRPAFTWFIDGVHIAPLLIIRAPESECGKTTVKDVVQQFVRRPLSNEGVSIAALFRVVEQEQPTLLLDDADSWLLRDPNDERHSLINSGHKRGGRVLRCVGDNHDLKAFSTFCAKVIAFIGKSRDTLHNRSIEIVLRRKMAGEKITPLRNADRSGYDTLRAKLARMEEDYLDTIANARPDLSGFDNRAADNWEPLLAVADLAGGEWRCKLRELIRSMREQDKFRRDVVTK